MSAIAELISNLIAEARARHPDRPALIGVGGAQGSGKSYQCRAYAAAHPRVAHFSLDDVYRTKAHRFQLADAWKAVFLSERYVPRIVGDWTSADRVRIAEQTFQLFSTRGPPGTHDLGVARRLIRQLSTAAPTPLPRFDKALDELAPESSWPVFQGPAHATLVDGWCMGALAPDASAPLNAVEQLDESREWRDSMSITLNSNYANFFAAFDCIIYLQAPSWEIVRVWRGEQEEETLGRPLTAEENAALDRFVMHYERVTRAMLAGHHGAGWIVHLDEARNVVRIEER